MFGALEHLNLRFVSNFVLRASDFSFVCLGSIIKRIFKALTLWVDILVLPGRLMPPGIVVRAD